ncbi:hypothetical protein [Streptomyces sp. NRRL WC-3618]|uniref:hypothetical protein n=1 Tax=Streptomyces sp. NRRL WC-3618 TaxID=1519490 RepID=UPI00131AC7AC|nr:hypothetical protein [Streptomyces sp. NRRL WC-3618]
MSPIRTPRPQVRAERYKGRKKIRSDQGKLYFTKGDVRRAAQKIQARKGVKGAWHMVPAEEIVTEMVTGTRKPLKLGGHDRLALTYGVRKVLANPGARASRVDAVEAPPTLPETIILDSPRWRRVIGPVYLADQVRILIGLPHNLLDRMAGDRSIIALHTKDGQIVYPAFQFRGKHVLPGLGNILRAFPDDDADLSWTIASWLRKPLSTLNDRSVVEALSDGDTEAALKVARATASRWSR